MFCVVYFLCFCLVAIDCLERLISKVTCYVSNGAFNPTHSLTTYFLCFGSIILKISDKLGKIRK